MLMTCQTYYLSLIILDADPHFRGLTFLAPHSILSSITHSVPQLIGEKMNESNLKAYKLFHLVLSSTYLIRLIARKIIDEI
jgi:hypothetical protein